MQSLPKLTFPGGVLVGCEAGFLNPAKIKGSHTAMKSGMLAAETIFAALALDGAAADAELARYDERVRESWLWDELHRGRNFSAGIAKLGTLLGGALAFVEQNLLARPRAVDAAQSQSRITRGCAKPPRRAAPAVSEAGRRRVVRSRELRVLVEHGARGESAVPLELADPAVPIAREPAALRRAGAALLPGRRLRGRRGRERRAAVSDQRDELRALQDVRHQGSRRSNITWVPPEGGGGPNYSGM